MTQTVTVKLALLGELPKEFDLGALLKWKSSVFTIAPNPETFQLTFDAEGDEWEYLDSQFDSCLNQKFDEDFMLIIVNVQIEDNWYVRRLSGNRILFSFYEIAAILQLHNIPLKNAVLRVLYAASLVYRRYGNRVPLVTEPIDYAHDETRGCLFDMNPSKWDIVYSCHEPRVCEACVASFKSKQVSNELIERVQREIKGIKKPLFNLVADFVKRHPVWSLTISVLTAVVVGTVSSVFGTLIYHALFGTT